MSLFTLLHAKLGLMAYPLMVMSVITVMIIIERLIFICLNSRTRSRVFIKLLYQTKTGSNEEIEQLSASLLGNKSIFAQGAGMLLNHRSFTKVLREEAVSIWLQKKRRSYTSGLKMLSIIGMISPLVGLLGTVLGLIEMFKSLSQTSNAIEPSLLADGLGLAMSTTAAGLLIAIPALMAAQLLTMWADHALAKIEHSLNHCNLFLEGVSLDQDMACQKAMQCVKSPGYQAMNYQHVVKESQS